MCVLKDITNQRFGRLVVISRAGVGPNGMATWRCLCDCGSEKNIIGSNLRLGKTTSCGCLQRQVAVRNGLATKKHGKTHTRTYKSWLSMKARCLNPTDQAYKYYGGRGIKIHPDWIESFETFLSDMGEAPLKHTLERIEVNGDYEPSNCKWATKQEQALNKRTTLYVIYDGEYITLKEAALRSSIPYAVLRSRMTRLKWGPDRLFSPYNPRKSTQ